jgi:hypothetical protein
VNPVAHRVNLSLHPLSPKASQRPKKQLRHRKALSPSPVTPVLVNGIEISKYSHQLTGMFQKIEMKVIEAKASKFMGFSSHRALKRKFRQIQSVDRIQNIWMNKTKHNFANIFEPFSTLNAKVAENKAFKWTNKFLI